VDEQALSGRLQMNALAHEAPLVAQHPGGIGHYGGPQLRADFQPSKSGAGLVLPGHRPPRSGFRGGNAARLFCSNARGQMPEA